ncbi:MAG TPA: polysaccharide deacetylase family protein [Myxococcales bacterium]
MLRASRSAGLFALARRLTRDRLRILCYHGTATRDEAAFRPELFIHPETFEQRLRMLEAQGYRVLPLEVALERLAEGSLPADAVALTIDDGFYGTGQHLPGALRRFGMPATLYVTSYYVLERRPVFRLVCQYVWWATAYRSFELGGLGIAGLAGRAEIGEDRERDPVLWRIIEHGEQELEEDGRAQLARKLGELLGVDVAALEESRALGLMTPEEIEEAARAGVDVQLHTHRHRFPDEPALARREVRENRAALEPLAGKPLKHLCYPSGVWSWRHFGWLAEEGIESATTCEVGFARRESHRLALPRVFDGSHRTPLEFEAEVSGFLEVLREIRARLRRGRGAQDGPRREAPGASDGPRGPIALPAASP